jgi:pimeloyl-ACP methyl ester carboxylesterase
MSDHVASMSVVCLLAVAAIACPSPPAVEDGMAPVEDGELYYRVQGSGTPVLLIHGGGLDHRMWEGQVGPLAKEFRVVVFDVRGFGRSSSSEPRHRKFEDVAALMDHLGISRASLVGLSLGGRIAIDFALSYPDRVRSLVLAGPGLSGWAFDRDTHAYIRDVREAVDAGDEARGIELWLAGPYNAPAMRDPEVATRLRRWGLDNVRIWRERPMELRLTPPAAERLDELRAPTLLIVGEEDIPDIHAVVAAIEVANPNAERLDLAGAGHLVNLERPAAFNRAVLEFLGRP